MTTVATIADVIRSHRFFYADEDRLQEGIAALLTARGIDVRREVPIGGGRIDILADRIGVEVKVAGSTAEVSRQLRRYADSPDLDGLVLVTSRVRHIAIPYDAFDKPFVVVTLTHGL